MSYKRLLRLGRVIVLVAVVIAGILATAERMYLVHGRTYPRFLATDAGSVDRAGLMKLRATACKAEPIEVYEKADFWVLRCGVVYYQAHTYISQTDPLSR
ncbi:hypothetical protein M3795_25180 [Ralstonia pickettii]|uniref:hypothetical protein n=1 Tax=Ralstonia pickettii TaxID=329 RepID=UPI00203A9959|nr:hypothetical protein [Ralstonia pickettii]MCM3583767.1 hypothetical protein [Ralstonia pickettii]